MDTAMTYSLSVTLTREIDTRRLVRLERRLRRLALRGQLGRPALAMWGAVRQVLDECDITIPESNVMPRWRPRR